jgi:YggT family protein
VNLICSLLQLYVLLILARVILTWFPISPDSVFATIDHVLRVITDPVLEPVRRALPPARMGGMALDFSPIIVILVLTLLVPPLLGC